MPKRSENKQLQSKKRCGRLYSVLLQNETRCILMDDETYVKMESSTLPGQQFYNAVVGEDVLDNVKAIKIDKFGKKFPVWQAICCCCLKSSMFFTTGTIGGEVYRKECIQKRLLTLYRKNKHSPLFWSDLASAHYSAKTLELLNSKNVDFVQKRDNPPNCPELRPIERYRAITKRYLIKDGQKVKTVEEFKQMWGAASRKISVDDVQRLITGIRAKVQNFYRS